MTVGELRKYLLNFPQKKEVIAEWEGVYVPLKDSCMRIKHIQDHAKKKTESFLVLDVDQD